jgi:hypothetical protein
MFEFLVSLLVLVILLALAWYILQLLPMPEPVGKIVQAVFVVVAVLLIVYLLLGLIGQAPRYPLLR